MLKTLKTFFIPHKGNNYHPHILHTKRALLYSGVFVFTKIIIIIAILLLPQQVFVMPDILQQEQTEVIRLTNEVRAKEGRDPLTVHTNLTKSSQAKAEDMATKQYFEHVSPEGKKLSDFVLASGYDYAIAGENLAMGFTDARELVDAWVNSPTHFENLIDADYVDFGVGIENGKYQNMDTVYVAQHFGVERTANSIQMSAVKGDSIQGKETTSSLVYYASDSHVSWEDDRGHVVLYAKVHASGDIASMEVEVGKYTIPLSVSETEGWYEGKITIFESSDTLFSVVLQPFIHISESNGDTLTQVIPWETVKIVSPTPVEKYTRAKEVLGFLSSIFSVSRAIYLAAIIFFTFALLLKILIEIRRQHPHVIVQTVLLIGLLVILFEV